MGSAGWSVGGSVSGGGRVAGLAGSGTGPLSRGWCWDGEGGDDFFVSSITLLVVLAGQREELGFGCVDRLTPQVQLEIVKGALVLVY